MPNPPAESEPVIDKLIEKDEAPPSTQAWYTSPQVLAAWAAIGGGIVVFCSAFHIIIPYSAAEITTGLGAAGAVLGGGFALYRRIRAGLKLDNDAPRITSGLAQLLSKLN